MRGAPDDRRAAPNLAPDGATAAPPVDPRTTVDDALRETVAALTRSLARDDPKLNADVVLKAFDFAAAAHAPQRRDNGDPYITHPVAVAEILAGYRLDTASIVTALLHDTIEDTPATLPEIERRFGATIAGLVDGVTKLTRLELQSDRTKQAENFRKLVLAMSRDIRVLIVKLADRLHNMRTLRFVPQQDRRRRIARETMEIYAPLADRIGMEALKTELQDRAFAELEPEAADTIQA
ncbi:MAG: HD domain-containing protein, partial [Acidisphaera sp.]|nr:HD domain-containing protein [Acidisphaera sp.]MBV9812194.1 HD domain-containing protein [Acetobacteraceae bacterium]